LAPLEEAGGLPDAEREAVWLDSGVREAVGSLNASLQQVLFLRVVEDMPFSRIASMLGASETAARMRYSRAIGRLRSRLPEVRE